MDFQTITLPILLVTDQTTCFDAHGNEIDCRGSGQDGESGGQRPTTADRFHPSGDVIEDRWTGLQWHQNANLPEFPLSWPEAFDYIRQMNAAAVAGINHWRLPARGELFSLVSHQNINPALPENHRFVDVFNGYYWTQTECARLPSQAWYIHLGGGRVYRGMKHGSYMVWPVAGAQAGGISPADRFQTEGDRVADTIAKRTWLAGAHSTPNPLTWPQALQVVDDLNAKRKGGFSDWRLPNIRELESLVDPTRHSPAIPAAFFPGRMQEGYWSSTTSRYEPSYAWVLYTRDGAVGVGYKPQADFFMLAVR